jgi:hypothetical protein
MEERKEYSEDDSFDKNKTASEYGNEPNKMNSDNSGNDSFGTTDKNETLTTGSGYSQAERDAQDATNGSQYLVDKYNINDQAHSDSSLDDFVKTTSGFRHADDVAPETNFNENPSGVSPND